MKTLNLKIVAAAVAALVLSAARADHAVRTAGTLIVTNDAEVVSPATVAAGQSGVPADMPDPVFWLDASDTEGWTIVNDGAHKRVKTVPSKGSSPRYATTAVSAENGDTWYGWWVSASNLSSPREPYLIDDTSLLPGKALDFNVPGTDGTGYAPRIGLVFNKVAEKEGLAPTNAIFNIGTVIAVYGSHDGRGWFLGGGRSDGGYTYDWNRETSQMPVKENQYDWTSAVLQSRSGRNDAQANGVVRHDGLPTSPATVGFNHGWEVVSWTMQSASAVATGIGLGDTRNAGFERTGQQRIAEMLIFDQVLPLETVEKIETYLNEKWFGRKIAGCGGKAEIGTLRSVTTGLFSNADSGIETEVAVAEGESLTIGRVEGGRGLKSVIRKTGEGGLAVRDAKGFGGKIALAGGTFSMPLKPIPASIDDIVRDCYYHADASAADTLEIAEENGVEYILGWRNLADGTYRGNPVMLAPIAANRHPELRRDALGEGRHIIDFGACTAGSDGRYLAFTTNAATQAAFPAGLGINGIVTVVAVYGSRGCGGNLFNSEPWSRAAASVDNYCGWVGTGMLDTKTFDAVRGLTASNAVIFADGVRLDSTGSFAKPGYQVLAIRHPGVDSITRIGCSKGNLMGGLQLGEIYVFRRQLSDDEMNDLSAYLAWKWFGTEINGYSATGRARATEIASLKVESPSTFAVDDGRTVRVGSVDLAAPLTVSGGGTLEIGELKNDGAAAIDASGATVKIVGSPEPVSGYAADPAFHLDPSVSGFFETNVENGTNFVLRARDGSMDRQLFSYSSVRCPFLNYEAVSSSLPVLDFGAFGYYGRFMAFDRPIDSVRSVYAVWAPHAVNNGKNAFMFGSTDRLTNDPLGGRMIDYHSGASADSQGRVPLFNGNSSQSHITGGEIYIDGVLTNRMFAPKAGELRLVELHHAAPAHIAAFATDRQFAISACNGGSMFGETLIYTRVLSEREKVATRNYLMKKWLGKTDAELAALPAREDIQTRKLAGEGTFVKAGANTLSIAEISSFTGTLNVAEGTLKITRPLPASNPGIVTDGLVFHVDAARGVEKVAGSANSVASWASTLGDGWSAVSANAYLQTPVNSEYPNLIEREYDGLPFVRMRHNKGHYMVFCKDGVRSRIKNIKTVFWVVGTDNGEGGTLGGGFLLGGGNASNPDGGTSQWNWHRGGPNSGAYGSSYDEPLTCGSATAAVRDGSWYMDGAKVDGYVTGLGSNKWHYITAVPDPGASNPASADGFAFDGRWLEGDAALAHRSGGQSLAEVLIYNRTLSEAERRKVEAYLSGKYGFTQANVTNAVNLSLAPGATLDCGGNLQYFASIEGAGTIDGDVTAAALTADAEATGWPSVTGRFVLPPKVKVNLRNLPQEGLNGLEIKILDCSAVSQSAECQEIELEGAALRDDVKYRLVFKDGALYIRFRLGGTVIMVR